MREQPDLDRTPEAWGICGGSGSGKSTLVALLVGALPPGALAVLPLDAYYRDLGHLAPAERARTNFDHPDAVDGALVEQHVEALRGGRAVELPAYDFAEHRRLPRTERVEPAPLVVVEGILLFAFPGVLARLDHTVFLDVPESVRLDRRIARDVVARGRTEASVRAQWAATVAPMHAAYVQPGARRADEVVPHGAELAAVAACLAARARALLGPGAEGENAPADSFRAS